MFGIGQGELIFLILLAIIILGPKRIPEAVKMVARAYHLLLRWKEEIQVQLSEIRAEMERSAEETEAEINKTEPESVGQSPMRDPDDYLSKNLVATDEYTYQQFLKDIEPTNSAEAPSTRTNSENSAN